MNPAAPTPCPPADGSLGDSTAYRLLGAAMSPAPGWLPPSVESLQQTLAGYEVQELIGHGGMGAIYRGVQKSLERTVAIKVLPPEVDQREPHFAQRFEHEAKAMASLSHPHIVPVYDFGETTDGLLYFAMEFVDGTDLAHIMRSEGRLSPRRAAAIISQVCEALEFAHERGVIHRDIKPSNIMVDRRGHVKVADFGLARSMHTDDAATSAGLIVGTRAYMAPEQARGQPIDHRADLYSVGVMFYEMLTGAAPTGVIEPPSQKAGVDARLDRIVLKALENDPACRYQRASEVKSDVTDVSGTDEAPPAPERRRFRWKWLTLITGIAVAAVASSLTLRPAARIIPSTVDRECAEQAMRRGASVLVRDAQQRESSIQSEGPLPEGEFTLLAIRFSQNPPHPPQLTASEIIQMIRAPGLTELTFFQSRPQLSDAVFAAIGACSSLRILNMNAPQLRDEWLRHLAGNENLEILRMPQSYMTDAGLAHLARLPGLREVDWNDSLITGEGITALASAPYLRLLKFGEKRKGLTHADLAAVAGRCSNLEQLEFGGLCKAADFRALATLPRLRTVVLSSQPLSAAHFESLAAFPLLTELWLIQCTVSDDAWPALARVPRVASLRLTSMRWPDAAAALAGMASLRQLELGHPTVPDLARARALLPQVTVRELR